MENQSKISKVALYLTILSFIIFTGSYISKLGVINQFFEADTMLLKSYFSSGNLENIFVLMLPLFSISLISFVCFILFFSIYIGLSRINFRNDGWLFVITLILVITSPFEIYLSLKYDLIIFQQIFKMDINTELIIDLLRKRITALGPFPLILLFSYFIIIFLAIFRPLRKKL